MKKRYADKLILLYGYGPLDIRWINFKLGGAFVGKGNNLIIGD